MSAINEAVYEQYLNCLLSGDFSACKATVCGLVDTGTTIRDIYHQLFQRSLYEVGRRWERNLVSVAVEHLATAITETLMGVLAPKVFTRPGIKGRAVIACVPGELHCIGARMTADIMQLQGWSTSFLGANLPISALSDFVAQQAPEIVGLSMSLRFHLPQLLQLIDAISRIRPEIEIALGGQGLIYDGPKLATQSNVLWFPDLCTFEAYLSARGVTRN